MEGGHQRPWESEDIDQGLAADLDDSLSGLGVDISTVSHWEPRLCGGFGIFIFCYYFILFILFLYFIFLYYFFSIFIFYLFPDCSSLYIILIHLPLSTDSLFANYSLINLFPKPLWCTPKAGHRLKRAKKKSLLVPCWMKVFRSEWTSRMLSNCFFN